MKNGAAGALDHFDELGALVHFEHQLVFVMLTRPTPVLCIRLVDDGDFIGARELEIASTSSSRSRDRKRGAPARPRRENGTGMTSTERSRARRARLKALASDLQK